MHHLRFLRVVLQPQAIDSLMTMPLRDMLKPILLFIYERRIGVYAPNSLRHGSTTCWTAIPQMPLPLKSTSAFLCFSHATSTRLAALFNSIAKASIAPGLSALPEQPDSARMAWNQIRPFTLTTRGSIG